MTSISYVTHMGSDLLVANAARKSFGAGFEDFRWEKDGPRSPRGRTDEALIHDLARDGHWLPFRHPHIVLACRAPLPVARQLGKHQVGFEWSEISRRYKTQDIHLQTIESWRKDVPDRRQGSGEELDHETNQDLILLQDQIHDECRYAYQKALRLGASPEQARYLLPQSMCVDWTWTGSLLAWAHMVKQRSHPDAQAETREFAEGCAQIIEPLFPVSWKALMENKGG